MCVRKIISILILILLSWQSEAQRNEDYTQNWKTVADFDKKGLTASALKEVVKIFNLALAAGNEPQQIKAAMYQMKYRNMVEHDNNEKNIQFLDTLIGKTKAPAKNILQSMQAELIDAYKQMNRYKFHDRTNVAQDNSTDISTWSLEKLNNKASNLYKQSLQPEQILKATSLNGLDAIITKGNSRSLRPTLFDFLANRALDYFMHDENSITEPVFKFILNDERIFAPASTFVNTKFTTKDTTSLYFNALQVLQDLLQLHINDKDPSAFIDADLRRLEFAYNHGVFTNKDSLYEKSLKQIEDTYPNNALTAVAMYMRARLYANRGEQYHPHTKAEMQFEIKRSIELAKIAANKFPSSEGGLHAKNLIRQLSSPVLHLETEKVNVPGLPFRALIKYKNIERLHFRIIKITREQIRSHENEEYHQKWNSILAMNAMRTWSLNLPQQGDYQQHSVEEKVTGLPAGTYYILASINPNFNKGENIIARVVTHVSNISYVTNNRNELYVLDRSSGDPLKGAEVQFWANQYNYSSRKSEAVKKQKYVSDVNGYIKLRNTTSRDRESYHQFLQINFNKEELYTDDTYYTYDHFNSYREWNEKRTFFFTDRAIYRPGQTVFFKGIIIATDSASKKSSTIRQFETTVFLYDANSQKAGQLKVRTNDFGSFNGSFQLPAGILNGHFYLSDSITKSNTHFNVEEYKRPRFVVEIKKPTGTYKINDSITITGNAKAYAGNQVSGASVKYRIVRKVMYPPWFWSYRIWPPYGSQENMEITNGMTNTDENGNFFITFKAVPDEEVDKVSQAIFNYQVIADITDINGETRSTTTTIPVSYQAIQVSIETKDVILSDSIRSILIKTSNLNGALERSTVKTVLYKLRAPANILRIRYWEAPDLSVMSKDEFKRHFPSDPYLNEQQMNSWEIEQTITEVTDTTAQDGKWKWGAISIPAGYYKILVTTKDKYGEDVKAEKFFQVNESNKTVSPIFLVADKKTAQPGDKINYIFSTGFDKIRVINNITRTDAHSAVYLDVNGQQSVKQSIDVRETDRGGISISYLFVKNNRIYSGSEMIQVPWSNKELLISYETFRDKLIPGSEERWKIKVSGPGADKVASEVLVNMYDASLDQFKKHNWTLLNTLWPMLTNDIAYAGNTFNTIAAELHHTINSNYSNVTGRTYDQLLQNGWNVGGRYYRSGRDMALGSEERMASAPVAVTADAMQEMSVTSAQKGNALSGKTVGVQANGNQISADTADFPAKNFDIMEIRSNFNETAFFYPALLTDAQGNVEFSFTIPEALTEWKLMTFAHTKELQSGYSEKSIVTQKPLMVQPNPTRFLREGDQIDFSAKIVNMTATELTGTSQLELYDAVNDKPVDGWFKNVFPTQYFTVPANGSFNIKFPVTIPFSFNSALKYRIRATTKPASDGTIFSDGEENVIPVVSNRMLVTETMPLNMRNVNNKTFRFDKLLQSNNSGSLTHHAFTVEYTTNPVWIAVQALPFLSAPAYESAEQNFNSFFANTLAAHIAGSSPRIRAVFEKWKTDSVSLLSNLQKNQELKSILLEETPWVLQSKDENEQRKNIALLFDMVRIATEKEKALSKLRNMQSPNGGFMWFKGGPDDRYITQYILTGIGHLRKLNALRDDEYAKLKSIVDRGIPYLDKRLRDEYDQLIRQKADLSKNHLSYSAIYYLYMRSFFPEYKFKNADQTAYNYYRTQALKYWLSQSRYMQGMIALSLQRTGDRQTPVSILRSLKENAIFNEELGMYWKDLANGGYYWHQAPVESHALMIEAFSEIGNDASVVNDLKTYLLKMKQVQHWKTSKATAEACYALLLNGSNWLADDKTVTITAGNTKFSSSSSDEAGTGYFKKSIEGDKVQQGMGNISVSVADGNASANSFSWGAVYWQYFEELDKITPSATPLKLVKNLFVEKNSDRGPVLVAIKEGDDLKVGDKIKVRIELRVDRDMEYIHMKDMRSAAMEPVNVISQYKYQGGLGYYETTKDASTNFFFSWLPRGTYVFEYPMFVTHNGNFSNGVTTIQSMYAPEFTSHSNGVRVNVEEKK